MIVKRVGVASVARIYGAITAAFGLLAGLIFAMASVLGAGFSETSEGAIFAPILGMGAIVVLPIIYGVMGLVGGAIGALLYNAFAGLVGGVEVDLEQR